MPLGRTQDTGPGGVGPLVRGDYIFSYDCIFSTTIYPHYTFLYLHGAPSVRKAS